MNREILLTYANHVKIFFMKNLCFAKSCKVFRPQRKLLRLFNQGKDKIQYELNIIKIIKNLKDLRILVKNKFLDDETRLQIKHNQKNIINIESTSSDNSDDGHHHHCQEQEEPIIVDNQSSMTQMIQDDRLSNRQSQGNGPNLNTINT